MESYPIDVPMPSMGATVTELTVVSLKATVGEHVTRGKVLAELESDKSVFEFESPCEGVIREVYVRAGDVRSSGVPILRIETSDASLRHLEAKSSGAAAPAAAPAAAAAALVWTPRALKLAQEAGLDTAHAPGLVATGPGGRVSGDDVAKYLAGRKT